MSSNQRKKVGLALGGGVARGMAHLGVLSVLEAAKIPIDYVAGTSAGSIVGALYAAGVSTDRIREYTMKIRWWYFIRLVWPVRGFFSFDPLAAWLIKEIGDLNFEDLKIPYAAVATDMETGYPVKLSKGRLAPCVQASCAVPGIIAPVEIDGRLLGDGSLADTVPVAILKEMGADYVIGVDIFTSIIRRRLGPLGLGFAALEILIQRAGGGIDLADCLIAPKLGGKTYIRFSKREELFLLGRDATLEKLDKIRADLGLTPSVAGENEGVSAAADAAASAIEIRN